MTNAVPWQTWAKLGRISNLPTVWTNALAGWLLAGGAVAGTGSATFLVLLLALSLFYVGGMYLNDAFDAEIDARERANRPIPAGEVSRNTVFGIGFVMLGAGIVLGFWINAQTGIASAAVALSVLVYDWLHKKTALSPVIMGLCRLFSYAMAAYAAGAGTTAALTIGAFGLFCHVVGLTYAAKQEAYNAIGNAWPLAVLAVPVGVALYLSNGDVLALILLAAYLLWGLRALRFLFRRAPGDVPRAVVGLIAGISLFDAALIAGTGSMTMAALGVIGFAATLFLQRYAPGT